MGVGKFLDELKQAEVSKSVNTDRAIVTESSKSVNTEVSKSVEKKDIVSLTVKVDRQLRQHWQIEAKKRGTTVSQIVVEALIGELGVP